MQLGSETRHKSLALLNDFLENKISRFRGNFAVDSCQLNIKNILILMKLNVLFASADSAGQAAIESSSNLKYVAYYLH